GMHTDIGIDRDERKIVRTMNWMSDGSESFPAGKAFLPMRHLLKSLVRGVVFRRTGGLAPHHRCAHGLRLIAALATATLTACTGIHDSDDFERHRHSRLVEPAVAAGVLYYDVRFSTAYPAGDAGADASRAGW